MRERREDITAYLKQAELMGGVSVYDALTPAALELVYCHPWDGNFRELQSFAEQLPPVDKTGSIDDRACRRVLDQVALNPTRHIERATRRDTSTLDWGQLANHAIEAFMAEQEESRQPASWNDVPGRSMLTAEP